MASRFASFGAGTAKTLLNNKNNAWRNHPLFTGCDKPAVWAIGLPQGAAIFAGLVVLDQIFGSKDDHHGHGHGTHDTHEKHGDSHDH